MRKADTFARQFRRAVVAIIGWEQKLGIEPSNPQISIGSETGPWLAALDARARAVPTAPVGRPPLGTGGVSALRTLLRPTGFVDLPFGHDGKVARLAGGLNWFASLELLTVEGGKRVAAELVPVEESRTASTMP